MPAVEVSALEARFHRDGGCRHCPAREPRCRMECGSGCAGQGRPTRPEQGSLAMVAPCVAEPARSGGIPV